MNPRSFWKLLALLLLLLFCSILFLFIQNLNDAPKTVVPEKHESPDHVVSCKAHDGAALGLIKNGTFEDCEDSTAGNWSPDSWGKNNASFKYPVAGAQGNGASVSITHYKSGDAKWNPGPIVIDDTGIYQYQESYKATVETELDIIYIDKTGKKTYGFLEKLSKSTSWKNIKTTFTVPEGTRKIIVYHVLASVGSLTIDNAGLEKVPGVSGAGHGMVTIDFDDGWESQYQLALPILEAEKIPATFYIIGKTAKNDAPNYMTDEQVKELADHGYDIQSHTVSHFHLPQLSPEEIKSEVVNSKAYLEVLTGQQISYLSYPYGEYDDTVIKILKEAGYRGARSTRGGFNNPSSDPYTLRATSIEKGDTIAEVKGWVDTAKRTNSWLIITFHHMGKKGDEYNASAEFLQEVIDYIKSQNMPFVSEADGVKILQKNGR